MKSSSTTIDNTPSYDGANRLTGINYADATTNTPLASFTYGYNADGQVTSYTSPEGTLNYSYDKDGELTGVSGVAQASYSYDANGNRTMSGYQTGPGNELLNDGQFTYTYDRNGNLLSKRDASGDVWSYSWDYRNRLTEVKETNAQSVVVLDEQFVYDVNDNLIGEVVNGVPQRWTVYDGSTPYLDLTGTGQVSKRYLADPNALAQYWARVGQTGQADWMVTDLLGSVRALVSASGSVEDQIAYDAYGNIVTETNPSAGGRLKYAGGQYDGGLGLTLFGARWYNSAAGRWLSQDPLGLGPDSNPYRYVGNGPTDGTDPAGTTTMSIFGIPIPTFPQWSRPDPREGARASQGLNRLEELGQRVLEGGGSFGFGFTWNQPGFGQRGSWSMQFFYGSRNYRPAPGGGPGFKQQSIDEANEDTEAYFRKNFEMALQILAERERESQSRQPGYSGLSPVLPYQPPVELQLPPPGEGGYDHSELFPGGCFNPFGFLHPTPQPLYPGIPFNSGLFFQVPRHPEVVPEQPSGLERPPQLINPPFNPPQLPLPFLPPENDQVPRQPTLPRNPWNH
jgi:RHS repeat-associated protein